MRETYDVLIVGAGQAGVQAADSLRRNGFEGTLGVVDAERHMPYERPPLSKAFLRGDAEAEEFLLRSAEYFDAHGIELLTGWTVTSVDPISHAVALEDGTHIGYGRLVWAAGGRARMLDIPGAQLAGVLTLRTQDDASALRDRLPAARRAVIIGGGYIGLEAAAAFAARGVQVTILEAQERLLARVTCRAVSDFYADLHRSRGTTVLLSSGVAGIVGEAGRAAAVELVDGTLLPADVVLVGVGLIPNVEPLAAAGAAVSNGLDVDESFSTSLRDVYAIGDAVNVRHPYASGARVRLESVPNAIEHGKAVAQVLTGADGTAMAAPWFWSHQFDVKLQTVGLQAGHDDAVVRGDVHSGAFTVVYLREGQVIALDCVNAVGDFAQGKRLVTSRAVVPRDALADVAVPLKSYLPQAAPLVSAT